jgi:transcription elongation factor Elf1
MPLTLHAIIDCGSCGCPFEGSWPAGVDDMQDLPSAPTAEQACPECGHTEQVEYPGWANFTEAG